MICLSLTADTLDADLRIMQKHQEFIDAVELRADHLNKTEHTDMGSFPSRARRRAGSVITILTVRRPEDGGAFAGTEAERLALLSHARGFDFVDLERDLRDTHQGRALAHSVAQEGARIIRSVHDFHGVPNHPAALLEDLARDGEIAKIAATPRGMADVDALLECADRTRNIEKILIGMGEYGLPTRILAKRFGSVLTFTSDPEEAQAAPGHLSPEVLRGLYRYHQIGPSTRFFGVVGNPVKHSRSPQYHNDRFSDEGIDACYVPILVDEVSALFRFAARLPLSGFSVTIPHKESILDGLATMDDGTRAAGACNTVLSADSEMVPSGDTSPRWHGVNTDVEGFRRPVEDILGRHPTGGATVIGAGGAARAIAYALLTMGLDVLILNRSPERAQRLADEVAAVTTAGARPGTDAHTLRTAPLSPETDLTGYRTIIVQTTSVGMHGDGDPAPWLQFEGGELVFDVVYTPPDTPFIRRARLAGCATIHGTAMFDAQAAAQFELFSRLAPV